MEAMQLGSDTKKETAIRRVQGGSLEDRSSVYASVGALCTMLSAKFPPTDAEPWDRTGLLVGDPHNPISRVAIALDPTVSAIHDAHDAGCNLLVTHHPAFLEPPTAIIADATRSYTGSIVFEAVRSNVALANYHTALDVSVEARNVLPRMLGLVPYDVLEPIGSPQARDGEDSSLHTLVKGYGHMCRVEARNVLPRMLGLVPYDVLEPIGSPQARDGEDSSLHTLVKGYGHMCRVHDDDPLTLSTLAARCTSVFGKPPRVWGSFSKPVHRVCTWTGSAGNAARMCLAQSMDVLICGEIKYHDALEAAELGLSLIELGHDISELPLATILAQAVLDCGIHSDDVVIINQNGNWQTPESRRV